MRALLGKKDRQHFNQWQRFKHHKRQSWGRSCAQRSLYAA